MGSCTRFFLAELHRLEEEGDSDSAIYYPAISGHRYEAEPMRDLLKEQSDSLVQSFVEAEEAMRLENQARLIPDKSDNNSTGYQIRSIF